MRVIFNGDDFGITESITKGMLEGLEEGWLNDISLMATGQAYKSAIAGLKSLKRDTVGIHLTAVDHESSILQRDEIALLLDHKCSFFIKSRNHLFLKAITHNHSFKVQLLKELRSQIQRVIADGFQISHLDSHQHIHVFPPLQAMFIGLAQEFNIPYIRVPYLRNRGIGGLGLNFFSEIFKRKLSKTSIKYIDFVAIEVNGMLPCDWLSLLSRSLNSSVTEVMVHPGCADDYTRLRYQHWNYQWGQIMKSLADPSVQESFNEKSIERIAFSDI